MNEAQFWELIREAKAKARDGREIPEWLEQHLSEQPIREIADFEAWLAMFVDQAHDQRLRIAGSIMAGGLSDDTFVYFQCWLIAQGENIFKAAIADPDSLAGLDFGEIGKKRPIIRLEELLYVTNRAYNKKMGRPWHLMMELPTGYQLPPDCRPVITGLKNADFEPANEVELRASFPKLTQRFLPVENA